MHAGHHREQHIDSAARRRLILESLDGLWIAVDARDRGIGRHILRNRFERNELDFVARTVGPGDHVVDAGAHVGLFTMRMAALAGRTGSVHAYEPVGANLECLAAAIRANRFGGRVVVTASALGAASGLATLLVPPRSNSGGAHVARGDGEIPEGFEAVPVRVLALDDCSLPRPIAFVKIDVEGSEPQWALGAARLLREDRPIVLAELDAPMLRRVSGSSPAQFVRQMAALGYRCRALGAGVPAEEVSGFSSGTMSVVFLPRSPGSERMGGKRGPAHPKLSAMHRALDRPPACVSS